MPWSVVGGARKLGFSSSSGMFCGPSTVAPYRPRCASGTMFEFAFQSSLLGSSLAYGTVDDGAAAVEVEVEVARGTAREPASKVARNRDGRSLRASELVTRRGMLISTVGIGGRTSMLKVE